MEKHEWRKSEKQFYLPKTKPEIIDVPAFKFITISGQGSPENQSFSDRISTLYPIAYAIKMTLKKLSDKPGNYLDYTVYPLEGIWDLNDEAKNNFDGTINKEDFVYKLMIRQPDFISEAFFLEMVELSKKKNPSELYDKVKFESITDGKCVQMLHIGSFDNEPTSFKIMEEFTIENNLARKSKVHREIYLSDFRKVPTEKLKTLLRFRVS
ncbi:GyrI-like domain-containing protein [Marinigracilibium pacificum]|uniref:GyrI-like small molecule binding domain-containing protein n=1 Tax=Marinigracilibium pacificum TaxID=2729599 RepID=A0A848J028_9BACT|nr:GyrI-like domain-containing protein [Marinigracilibium pacificum]NMM47609.1 hypothetical protein [Marinigracilibium pacificum]